MAARVVSMGGLSLEEKSYGKATAVALHSTVLEDPLFNVRRFKQIHNAIPKEGRLPGPLFYPADPTKLADTHPALWEGLCQAGEIVKCPEGRVRLAVLKKMQPNRNTKGLAAAGGPASHQLATLPPAHHGHVPPHLHRGHKPPPAGNLQAVHLQAVAEAFRAAGFAPPPPASWDNRGPRRAPSEDALSNLLTIFEKPQPAEGLALIGPGYL